MDLSLLYQLKDKQSRLVDWVFYGMCILLVATIFCYGIFAFKVYLENKKVDQMNVKLNSYGTSAQKSAEAEVLNDKKKIDDFTAMISHHRISTNVFSFIEENTLPNVWFSNFRLSEVSNVINLSGEADTASTLSRQVQIFEQHQDYISNISVLDFQTQDKGNIKFSLNLAINPNLFSYATSSVFPVNPPQTSSVPTVNNPTTVNSSSPGSTSATK